MNNFPSIKRETVATHKGNFYVIHNGSWRKMELYLPAATGTYNEPLEITANRFLDDIESGKRPFKYAISDVGEYVSGSFNREINRWF